MNSKRFLTWFGFILIIGLIIWGLVAAEKKEAREEQVLVLPTQVATSTDRIRGSDTAPVTLVEYGDFQCPACRTYHTLVEQLIAEKGPDNLRFIFRHFPLPQHGNAVPASRAAEAAGLQGKFWEMYNILYENQPEWQATTTPLVAFTDYARQMGLDEGKFVTDYSSDIVKEKVDNDYKGGVKGGINSTPTFFVNGQKIPNPQSYNEFKTIIDNAAPKVTI